MNTKTILSLILCSTLGLAVVGNLFAGNLILSSVLVFSGLGVGVLSHLAFFEEKKKKPPFAFGPVLTRQTRCTCEKERNQTISRLDSPPNLRFWCHFKTPFKKQTKVRRASSGVSPYKPTAPWYFLPSKMTQRLYLSSTFIDTLKSSLHFCCISA